MATALLTIDFYATVEVAPLASAPDAASVIARRSRRVSANVRPNGIRNGGG
jgi:hypothetical protein